MDLTSLLGTVMSANSTGGISTATGVSNAQTQSVLTAALPLLLGGALSQSTNAGTASGFANALSQHAADDTADLGAFNSQADLKDGDKIVSHLLGSNKDAVIAQIAGNSGVKKADVKKVLAAAAPLLMSLLGKEVGTQQQANNSAGVSSILTGLLGGGGNGTASLLTGLLGGAAAPANVKPAGNKPSGGKPANNNQSGGLTSLLMGLLK